MLNKLKTPVKYLSVLFVSLLGIVKPVCAQEITAINFNGDLIGKVIPDGSVVSFDNDIIGNVTADSLIVNAEGELIGGIIPQGVVIGNDNRLMGRVNNDGSVRLPSGKIIGKVLPTGLVVDDSYSILGTVLFPGLIYNEEGKTVGRLTGDGLFIGIEGQNVGYVSANGYAYRNNGTGYVLDGRLISSKMVISIDGNFIGSVVPGGKVTDFESRTIGTVHANGYVYDVEQKIVGKTVNSGYAFDNNGNYIGLVSYNGDVIHKGEVVGHLRGDEKIVNGKKEVIGFKLDLAATATDLKGRYLGRLIPDGKIVKAQDVIGKIGPRGMVLDNDGKVIGQITTAGPLFDYLGNMIGQSLHNGTVISMTGAPLGYIRGKLAYDNIGRILGAANSDVLVFDANNNILGVSPIGSELVSNSEKYKISPFGYVYSSDYILNGHTIKMSALYDENGEVSGYVSPLGDISGMPKENQIKLTQFGYGINPENKTKAFSVEPYFAIDSEGANFGIINQNNRIIDNQQKAVAKIMPEYVLTPEALNLQMPILGTAGQSFIAVGVNGNMLGYADYAGIIKDYSGNKIGQATESSLILNNQNSVIGQLMPLTGIVNNECSFLGVLGTRGQIRNSRDIVLGSILTNGQVISEVGDVIGHSVLPGSIINFAGEEIGTVNALDKALSYDNSDLGCVRWNGKVYDQNNALIGRRIDATSVMDFNNVIVGRLLANGQVIGDNGSVIGAVQPDDTFVDNYKNPAGIAFRYRFAFDNNNNFLGRVNRKGEVIDGNNVILGTVSYEGAVFANGDMIGYALYDFYIYNNYGFAIGYLLSDGTVSGFSGGRLGRVDKGFLIDRNNNLIGRGNRDYTIRNDRREALGELTFDGELLAYNGTISGKLSDNGFIFDENGNQVGWAHKLQYYDLARPEIHKPANWANDQIRIEPIPEQTPEEESGDFSFKAIGIALTPDGNYLGEILANNDVVDKLGNLIGTKTPDGLIIDNQGSLIGIEETQKAPTDQMFVPAGTFGPGGAYGIGNMPTNLGPGGGFGPGERYDPVRSAALAAAQQERLSSVKVSSKKSGVSKEDFTGWQDNWDNAQAVLSSWRVDMSEMILADKPIPAVLARTFMSGEVGDVPATAYVERNVYAEDGRNVIIPAGSHLIGEGKATSAGGEDSGSATRVTIVWRRLIRPDGSAFDLSAAPTGDAQGRAGALGYIDQRLLQKYSLPIVSSLMTSAIAYFTATDQTVGGTNGDAVETSRQQAANDARQNFIDKMDGIFQEIMEQKANVKAVTYVPAGTRITVYPMVDLWIRSIERAQKEEGYLTEKPEHLINPNSSRRDVSRNSGSSGGKVVYEDDTADVEPAKPLMGDSSSKRKKKGVTAIPPVTSTGATPPPPSTDATGYSAPSRESPQLF